MQVDSLREESIVMTINEIRDIFNKYTANVNYAVNNLDRYTKQSHVLPRVMNKILEGLKAIKPPISNGQFTLEVAKTFHAIVGGTNLCPDLNSTIKIVNQYWPKANLHSKVIYAYNSKRLCQAEQSNIQVFWEWDETDLPNKEVELTSGQKWALKMKEAKEKKQRIS